MDLPLPEGHRSVMPDGRKKQWGQQRKLQALLRDIDAFVPYQRSDEAYEHFHVPCARPFLTSSRTRGWVRTAFCRKWLETAERFIAEKPAELPFCKVVAALEWPDLWESQLILFYDRAYYEGFWDRQGPGQIWTPLPSQTVSEVRRRGIRTMLPERGYAQCIQEEDGGPVFRDTLWFYGEI